MDRNTFETTMMTFKRRSPFRPYYVAMVNGDRLEIDHPEALVLREGVSVFVGPGGAPAVFDHEGVSQIVGDLANSMPSAMM